MSPETNAYEKLLVALARADIQFLTVGGVACALCGFVRTTEDVDILVSRDPANITALLQTLANFGEGHAQELTVADFADDEGCIRIVEDFPLDVFVRMDGRTYEDLLTHRAIHEVGDARIPYLNSEGLILLKQTSAREKDRIDVAALRRIIKEGQPPE